MTREEIENMPAGSKINMLVELHVFGWPKGYDDARDVPLYSEDIGCAWLVIKEMNAKNFWFGCQVLSSKSAAWFNNRVIVHPQISAPAFELPLAICRAALLTTLS